MTICSNCGLNVKRYDVRDFKKWMEETNQLPPYDIQTRGLGFNWNFLHLFIRSDSSDTNYRFNYHHEINDLFPRGKKHKNTPFIWGCQIEKVQEWMEIWEMERNLIIEKENLELKEKIKELEMNLNKSRENLEDFIDKSQEWHQMQLDERDEEIYQLKFKLKDLESRLENYLGSKEKLIIQSEIN